MEHTRLGEKQHWDKSGGPNSGQAGPTAVWGSCDSSTPMCSCMSTWPSMPCCSTHTPLHPALQVVESSFSSLWHSMTGFLLLQCSGGFCCALHYAPTPPPLQLCPTLLATQPTDSGWSSSFAHLKMVFPRMSPVLAALL